MDAFTIIAFLVILSTSFSYINERFIKMPNAIGVVVISVVVSILTILIGKFSSIHTNYAVDLAQQLNFPKLLLDVMLAFLLFATALRIDYRQLREMRRAIIILCTVSLVISTFLFAGAFYYLAMLLQQDIPFIYCLLFGAIISPTDPIAVASMLKKSALPPNLQAIISGESMFNDAVALVLFVTIYGIATNPGGTMHLGDIGLLFAQEVLGGLAFGAAAGYLGYRLIRGIKSFENIFLVSISVVFSVALAATEFHFSAPFAAIVAGLVMGEKSIGLKTEGSAFLERIWELIDDALNTVLFVMIGLELVIIPFGHNYWLLGGCSILFALGARWLSVTLPAVIVMGKLNMSNQFILTWAGLRGGISIAMALTLPVNEYAQMILSACYIVVIFSVIVQGLTLRKVVAHLLGRPKKTIEKT